MINYTLLMLFIALHTTHAFYSSKLRQKTLNIYEKCSL